MKSISTTVMGLSRKDSFRGRERQTFKTTEAAFADTDLTIGEIASRCGFACTSYLAVLMKKVHGTTPLNYRKRTRDFRT